MNKEIQVGEYVRTNNGSIFKIIGGNVDDYLIDVDYYDLQKMEDDIYDELMWLNYNDNGNFIRRIVKKHSFNIIDLIEVGDYVNGIEVEVIGYDNNENGELVETLGVAYVDDDVAWRTELKDISHIYTIVTHEQFKAMAYKVGVEDD